MKKTMFKRIFTGIAAMFMMCMFLPMCSMEFMPNAEPNTEAEDDGWTLDEKGVLTVNNNTTINKRQFRSDSSINEVKIGYNCNIGEEVFYKCKFLESVKIGEGCDIGESAFKNCTSLTNVTIDERCTIGRWAFDRCNSIQKVICIGDKNTVTVDDDNLEIICNKDKWLTATKCPKCQGPVIDYICESCGYIDEAAAQAESARLKDEAEQLKAEAEQLKAKAERIDQLIAQNKTEDGNTATTFSDGSILAIIGGSTFLILCGLAAVIIVKRRKKTQ